MKETETLLVDARAQVRAALGAMETETPFTLCAEYPKGGIQGDTVVFGEYSNTSTDCPVVDRIVFQVDLYTPLREHRQMLGQAVNRAMTELGLRRVYASADGYRDEGAGCYHKCYRFGRRVDKRSMRLID
jgi:hypothetical protein